MNIKGGIDGESWEELPDHRGTVWWESARCSPSLEGHHEGLDMLLPCLSCFHVLPPLKSGARNQPHCHPHPKLNLGDRLAWGPVSLWMKKQGEK